MYLSSTTCVGPFYSTKITQAFDLILGQVHFAGWLLMGYTELLSRLELFCLMVLAMPATPSTDGLLLTLDN